MIAVTITKRIKIIQSIQLCLISYMNINHKENGGKRTFSCKPKASILCIAMWRKDCSANNKKNGDYYEYPILSQFTDEL